MSTFYRTITTTLLSCMLMSIPFTETVHAGDNDMDRIVEDITKDGFMNFFEYFSDDPVEYLEDKIEGKEWTQFWVLNKKKGKHEFTNAIHALACLIKGKKDNVVSNKEEKIETVKEAIEKLKNNDSLQNRADVGEAIFELLKTDCFTNFSIKDLTNQILKEIVELYRESNHYEE